MIRGTKKEAVPYVIEDDRSSDPKEQTIFWIKPKKSHEANLSLQRYASTARDGRGGYKEFNVKKLDSADIEEFTSLVERVENYGFAEDSLYYKDFDNGIVKTTDDKELLAAICTDLASNHLAEILEVAGDPVKLETGRSIVKKKRK